jgi:hypothetical protein
VREKVLTRLCRQNATVAPPEILRCTQKLLDRVLFCAFCECRGLLPAETLKRAFEHRYPYNPHPVWHNFRGLIRANDEGNSVISDPAVHPKAFDWQAAFPEVFAQGGFDVVVGNPHYIRQELLSPFKPWLEAHYEVFHGMADLYVYFYELGVRMLQPRGLLCFVVTNKWMKARYGKPLRRFCNETEEQPFHGAPARVNGKD